MGQTMAEYHADKGDVLVVEILAADGATITKESDGTKTGSQYRFPTLYRLIDGRLIETSDVSSRLRDAKASLAALATRLVDVETGTQLVRYTLYACFDGDGDFYGTCHTFDTLDFLSALDRLAERS